MKIKKQGLTAAFFWLPTSLHRQLKAEAAVQGITLTAHATKIFKARGKYARR